MPRKRRLTPLRRPGPNVGALVSLPAIIAEGVGWIDTLDDEKLSIPATAGEAPHLVYVASGVVHVAARGAKRVLPPRHALWAAAGESYALEAREPVQLRRVVFDAALGPWPDRRLCGLYVPVLGQALLTEGLRWPRGAAPEAVGERTFACLAAHLGAWVAASADPHLAGAHTPSLQRVMKFATEQMHTEPTIEDAAALVGVSARTLARRFADETDTSWRRFLHEARMLRAMELLVDPTVKVQDIAYAIGFNSLGAFTRAFQEYTGVRPRDWRHRTLPSPGG